MSMTARKGAETPETDAFLRAENCHRDNPVAFDWLIGHARSLERQLTAAREDADKLRMLLADVQSAGEYEVHRANERAAAAEAALTEHNDWQQKIAALLQNGGMHDWAFIYGQIRGCIEVCERRGARAAEGE